MWIGLNDMTTRGVKLNLLDKVDKYISVGNPKELYEASLSHLSPALKHILFIITKFVQRQFKGCSNVF